MRKRLVRLGLIGLAGFALFKLLTRNKKALTDSSAGVSATTAMQRNAAVAKTGARVGAAYAVHQAKRATASPEKQAELDAAFEMKTAEEVVNVLGNMKGALMKIGQMASFLDDGLPEPLRDALATLQADAPPMSSALAAQVIEQELGAPPDQVFASWEEKPLSAASIGQVHRAVTKDGLAVAVKVQYPGVDEAIMADLDNSQMLSMVLGMVFPSLDPKPMIQEIRERLSEEVDYRLEAKNQSEFRTWYEDHPFIHIPRVIHEHSAQRVLTTELADGVRFGEVDATWSDEQKNMAAEAIYRFVFRSLWHFKAFNGDPHPGNYLFRPDGRVTFLDFGLVKHFTDESLRDAQELIETLVLGDDVKGYRRKVESLGMLQPDAPLSDDEVEEYFAYFYKMLRQTGVHTITHDYAAGMLNQFFNTNDKVLKFANLVPDYVILQRINLGLMAILAELHATFDWRSLTEEIWPFTEREPTTRLGREEAEWVARLKA